MSLNFECLLADYFITLEPCDRMLCNQMIAMIQHLIWFIFLFLFFYSLPPAGQQPPAWGAPTGDAGQEATDPARNPQPWQKLGTEPQRPGNQTPAHPPAQDLICKWIHYLKVFSHVSVWKDSWHNSVGMWKLVLFDMNYRIILNYKLSVKQWVVFTVLQKVCYKITNNAQQRMCIQFDTL